MTRWFVRLPGHDTPADALDDAERRGACAVRLYGQPSVPVCGTVELRAAAVARDMRDELVRLRQCVADLEAALVELEAQP